METIRCSSSTGSIGRWSKSAPFAKVKSNLWRLYNLATGYGKSPSEITGLPTDLGKRNLDEGCLIVGRRVEKKKNEGKDAFTGFSLPQSPSGNGNGRYRSAKGRITKRLQIPANGIW